MVFVWQACVCMTHKGIMYAGQASTKCSFRVFRAFLYLETLCVSSTKKKEKECVVLFVFLEVQNLWIF